MSLFAYAAMAAIFALRYQRNLLAESWALVTRSQTVAAALDAAKPDDDARLRKCKVAGKVLYSNVACSETNRTTQTLDLAKNEGFLAPQVPPVAIPKFPAGTETGL